MAIIVVDQNCLPWTLVSLINDHYVVNGVQDCLP